MTGAHVRAVVMRVLERHESRCLDDEDDRAAVADALLDALPTELQLPALPFPDSTHTTDTREDGSQP